MLFVREVVQRFLGRSVSVSETTDGFGPYSQEHLPGERTVVLSYSRGEFFFEVDEERGVVVVPETFDENFPIGPSDGSGIAGAIVENTDYDVVFEPVMNR